MNLQKNKKNLKKGLIFPETLDIISLASRKYRRKQNKACAISSVGRAPDS